MLFSSANLLSVEIILLSNDYQWYSLKIEKQLNENYIVA